MRSKILLSLLLITFTVPAAFAQDRADALELYRTGQYRKAVEVCLQEIEEMPRRLDAYAVLGWSLLRLGDYQNVIKYMNMALSISRFDHRVMEILAEAFYYTGNNLEALKYFQEYVNLSPTGRLISDVYFFMGEIFIRLGEYNHADIAFTTALYHSPNVAMWWARLGYAREMAKEYDHSVVAYDKALKLNPGLDEARRGKERVQAAL